MQRDYRFYIDKAKEKQGFKYDNQVESALGFKGSMISIITKPGSHKHLSEEKMMELAALGGQSDIIALMDLQILKAEGAPQQNAYKEILKRISAIATVVLIGISPAPASANVNIEYGYYGNATVYYGK